MQLHRDRPIFASLLCGSVAALSLITGIAFTNIANADVWVFEPSAGLDFRLDSNFPIDPVVSDPVAAARGVGSVTLSREAPAAKFSGLLRVDGLISQSDSRGGQLDRNTIALLNSEWFRARSTYGINLSYTRDTPSRDIAADITDIANVAEDTGNAVAQDQNVDRERFVLSPNWRYNLTRRTAIEADLSFTQVTHQDPSVDDALRARFSLISDEPPPDPITIEDTGLFTVLDELDDFREIEVNLGLTTKLTPISTLSFFASYSDFSARVEADPSIVFPFVDTIGDPDNMDIRRRPRRDSFSNTTTLRLGYDRNLDPTLTVGAQVGVFLNQADNSDILRETDNSFLNDNREELLDNLVTSSNGFLANITATKTTGITQYSARFGVDVQPSSIGSQVETLEVIGDVFREIGPLLDFSFRIRAFEPDALNAADDNAFARRFLSMEPKLIWRFTRAWTAAGSYRYRRQKSQADIDSGESHAVLFSIKYTPPSAIRDAEAERRATIQ